MAEKRFLSRRITDSDKIRALANEQKFLATSLYTWLLPYTDRAGRVNANGYYLLGGILQGYAITLDQLTAALQDLARVGLVHLYANGRYDRIIQYAKFHVDDGGFNKPHDREAASSLPGPDDAGSTSITTVGTGTGEVRDEVRDQVRTLVANPAKTRSTPPPGQGPGELKVEIELEVETEIEKEPSSISAERQPPSPQLVEAEPRRELSRSSKAIQKGKARDLNAVRAIDQPFVDAWNENRGPLPSVLSLDQGRRRHLDKLRAELGDEALDVFTDATKQLAREPFYRQKGYGLTQLLAAGNLLTWAEKWRSTGGMSDQDRRLADKARAVADAIGGL